MNIIFGNTHELDSKHIILELDTFRLGPNGPEQTAYCIIENMPLEEMIIVENLKESHQQLMNEYRNQNWNECEQIINKLMGKWGGEIDSFYEILNSRISELKTQIIDKSWTGIIEKS